MSLYGAFGMRTQRFEEDQHAKNRTTSLGKVLIWTAAQDHRARAAIGIPESAMQLY
jgi:hypothetical protein